MDAGGPFWSKRFSILLSGALCLAVLAFWTMRVANARAIESTRVELRRLPTVNVIGGLKIPFELGLSPVSGQAFSGRQLLLFGSDECPYTADVLQQWIDLINSLPFQEDDGVTVVGIGERTADTLQQAATERGVRVRLFRVTDPVIWSAATGILGTPTTLALDEEGRVRLFPSRELLRANGPGIMQKFFAREL